MRNILLKIDIDSLSDGDKYKLLEKIPTEMLLTEIWRRFEEKDTEIKLFKERYVK